MTTMLDRQTTKTLNIVIIMPDPHNQRAVYVRDTLKKPSTIVDQAALE